MRLFHVSEENNIEIFYPRSPKRVDLNQEVGLVWAIDEKRLPNFLTPRDCPRVTYHINSHTTEDDKSRFFSCKNQSHVVVIESKWFKIMQETTLYLYEFDATDFELQDSIAGFYVSKKAQKPIAKYQLDDLFKELFDRNIEFRVADDLWSLFDQIIHSSLNYSMCRMGHAQKRKD